MNKEYHLEYYYKKRQELIDELGGCCCQCFIDVDLQFDHKDPLFKTMEFKDIITRKRTDEMNEELKNCQLLCFECHLKKSVLEKQPFVHGTMYAFMRKKCKCFECEVVKCEYNDKRNKVRRKAGGYGPQGLFVDCGTCKSYNRGCRCDDCRLANALKEKLRRQFKK